MDGRAYSLVRASALRVCVVPARGLGMTACLMCGAVQPCAVLSASRYAVYIYIGAYELPFTRACLRCTQVCMSACTAPGVCSPGGVLIVLECVYARV